jgi:hypothetical protein
LSNLQRKNSEGALYQCAAIAAFEFLAATFSRIQAATGRN